VYLANQSADTLRGPFVAQFLNLTWPYGRASLHDAEPSRPNVLDLTPTLAATLQMLAPGTRSGPLPLRFVLTDLRAARSPRDAEVTFEARVLAKPLP
jgi:hypothetical protein